MTDHATAGQRTALMGLLVAGALAATAGSANAQYYSYFDEGDPFPPYREFRQRDYGYRYAPPPPSVRVAPNDAGRHFAARNYGLARIDRSVDRGNIRIVDGVASDGRHLRVIVDAYSGDLLRRITLPGEPRPAPRVARVDPREEHAPPRPNLVPQPPERPAELKPPAEASAPTTTAPPPAAKPPEPSPGPADPRTGADKPKLVNPDDVRGIEEGERKPPIAAAQPAVPAPAPAPIEQPAPAAPTPVTPAPDVTIAPVAPLE
ncbi:hypothetical protein [Bosea sp. BH3]|uniref:hypothetical protein n=1 Tax=Bosea sp. BH3 TaxID=2871701 RepID=UPI0021CB1FCB|nr:hypothetical protein [Bosea sp. BH3]MCU4178146.1 hypothetical protein [Bosea sp. BH3]